LWLGILLAFPISGLNRGVVHIVVAGYNVDHFCLIFDRGVVHIVVAGYNVDHFCLIFDRGVVHIVMAGDIVDHFCLKFDREVVHIIVAGYIVYRCQISNRNGQHYIQPQQYEPLLCLNLK
jgi:hypothetical protein